MPRISSAAPTARTAPTPVMRERPATVHAPIHPTRDVQESLSHAPRMESEPLVWRKPTALDAPAPRQGYVQRWVRDPITAEAGDANFMMKMREGWKPRDPNSMTTDSYFTKSRSSVGADAVRVGNLVLCEMPEQVFRQREAYYADQVRRQSMTVSHKETDDASRQGQGLFGKIEHHDSVSSTRGRPAPIMTDD